MQQPTLPVHRIDSSTSNHRTHFDPAKLKSLEAGVRAAGGVLEPIIVRPIEGGRYRIIAGERRWRVARTVYGDDYEIPVVVRDASDAEAEALGIIENHHRDDVSLAEQARGASRLLYFNRGDKTETALQLGWRVETLERRLLLLACSGSVLDALAERRILTGHAELLAGLASERQDKVLAGILEHRVTVEVLKKQLGQFARKLADAIFDTAVCAACPHNSAKQSGLFDESLGDGYCQNPTHYEELTMQAIEAQAMPLRERYPVVKIVTVTDGFIPLVVQADGDLGVGAEQYAACQGCAHFGCSVSAVAGTYGQQLESLCFDPVCNSQKVAQRRKAAQALRHAARGAGTQTEHTDPGEAHAQRFDSSAPAPDSDPQASSGGTATLKSGSVGSVTTRTGNDTPPRVVQYRIEQWRKWAANALMNDTTRNHCTLAALVLSSNTSAIDPGQFTQAAGKLVGSSKVGTNLFRGALEQADAFERDRLPLVVQAVAASAAFGLDVQSLEILLNYLSIDEARCFTLNTDYLQLLTISELESLADELKLKKALGEQYKKARAGKKDAFIVALLAAPGITYAGLVPRAMRYTRRKLRLLANESKDEPRDEPIDEPKDETKDRPKDAPVGGTPGDDGQAATLTASVPAGDRTEDSAPAEAQADA